MKLGESSSFTWIHNLGSIFIALAFIYADKIKKKWKKTWFNYFLMYPSLYRIYGDSKIAKSTKYLFKKPYNFDIFTYFSFPLINSCVTNVKHRSRFSNICIATKKNEI